jgi:hypothetical protein
MICQMHPSKVYNLLTLLLQAGIKIPNPKPIFIIVIQKQCLSNPSIQEMNVKAHAQK